MLVSIRCLTRAPHEILHMTKMHDVRLSPEMVARVMTRRGGRLHAFDRLDPARTALLVIDMQNVWVKPGMPAYTPDTVIITGTATNVCCEATARDAFMLNYRTLVVSDANATTSDEAHNASLNALFNRFADVFTTDEVADLLQAGAREDVPGSPPQQRASA